MVVLDHLPTLPTIKEKQTDQEMREDQHATFFFATFHCHSIQFSSFQIHLFLELTGTNKINTIHNNVYTIKCGRKSSIPKRNKRKILKVTY